jgi:hypothetical protein
MKHLTVSEFWKHYDVLPPEIQTLADKNFALLKENPHYPSLHLKKVGRYWSVRVGLDYRALGADVPEGILWFWIGPHRVYERLIVQ